MIKIITISREFGSGGRTIGKEVAKKLGIPCYDKELIEKIAEEIGEMALHLKANKEIKNSLSYMKPSGRIIKGIYSIGFAASGRSDVMYSKKEIEYVLRHN